MIRTLDIALKDLLQLLRERETFLFFLIMPVAFTVLFGFAFGGFGGEESDPRLPVGYLDQDGSTLSLELRQLLLDSEVIRLEEDPALSAAELEQMVTDEDLAAAILVPVGYGVAAMTGTPARIVLMADPASPVGMTVQRELLAPAQRLISAVQTARIVAQVTTGSPGILFSKALTAWERPPIAIAETASSAIEEQAGANLSLAHTSPGMMLQFAVAGLNTAAQLIVGERKSRVLQRLFTTATARIHILLGHFLAILVLVLTQFTLLIGFAQLALKVDYLREPGATVLVGLSAALCIAAMGLLIGSLAKSAEQAVIFSLVPMFALAGLGGAWVPLEVTSPTFQAIGHLSPIAWGMDGFKNIVSRGLGLESVLLPAAALLGYAVLFFCLAAWRFETTQES